MGHLLCCEGITDDGEGECATSLFADGNGAWIGESEGARFLWLFFGTTSEGAWTGVLEETRICGEGACILPSLLGDTAGICEGTGDIIEPAWCDDVGGGASGANAGV